MLTHRTCLSYSNKLYIYICLYTFSRARDRRRCNGSGRTEDMPSLSAEPAQHSMGDLLTSERVTFTSSWTGDAVFYVLNNHILFRPCLLIHASWNGDETKRRSRIPWIAARCSSVQCVSGTPSYQVPCGDATCPRGLQNSGPRARRRGGAARPKEERKR